MNNVTESRVYAKMHAKAMQDLAAERLRQDLKWGGAEHDDKHDVADFCRYIRNYTGWAEQMADMGSEDKARRRLVQVAALAVAAVESMDRKRERYEAKRAEEESLSRKVKDFNS